MRQPVTKISFNPKVAKRYTREQFIDKYSALFPDANIAVYADSLGLISEPVAEQVPAAFALTLNEAPVPGTAEEWRQAARKDAQLLADALNLPAGSTGTGKRQKKGGKKQNSNGNH
jgi:hypothetical protein